MMKLIWNNNGCIKMKPVFEDKLGFTLIEVIIGVMILTVAIVSTTSLLVNVLKTNNDNAHHVQAYYLAQEGIEAVRNVRDTNWMHNLSFNADGVYSSFKNGKSYSIFLRKEGWSESNARKIVDNSDYSLFLPFDIEEIGDFNDSLFDEFNENFGLNIIDDLNGEFYSHNLVENYEFYRHIDILDACDTNIVKGVPKNACEDFMIVRSTVNWQADGGGSVKLYALFSDWKGGAL